MQKSSLLSVEEHLWWCNDVGAVAVTLLKNTAHDCAGSTKGLSYFSWLRSYVEILLLIVNLALLDLEPGISEIDCDKSVFCIGSFGVPPIDEVWSLENILPVSYKQYLWCVVTPTEWQSGSLGQRNTTFSDVIWCLVLIVSITPNPAITLTKPTVLTD